ncbi:MAG TPA: potassium channel family protein [Anaerolineales bacterium]|nr:potassium channel family protein [Anaerolineales bacterium]
MRALFLLDVIQDRDSRPVFLWAASALLIGTLAYHWLEGWSLLDSLYFSVITLATVGYGDFVPSTPIARLFTILYVINGISILLALLDRIRVVRSGHLERAVVASGEAPASEA